MNKIIVRVQFTIFAFILLVGCEKFDGDDILGIWISTDKTDTLDFVDNSNFYKSAAIWRRESYDYHLDKDSIEIRYSGPNMILIQPTKHVYELDGNTLMLDLRNKFCYGFSSEKIYYDRQ